MINSYHFIKYIIISKASITKAHHPARLMTTPIFNPGVI